MTSSKVLSKEIFHTATGSMVALRGVVADIRNYVSAHADSSYEIVIGSDSQATLKGQAAFVTAIVVRRIGNGGVSFWTRHEEKFFNLKDRIWKEAMLSITLAQELRTLMKEEIGEEIFWEGRVEFRCIHIDVGMNGPTKDLIDGISGMVKGYGFVPVIKPFSYGAFVVADKHT
ncbi:MAG: ribonuclease H-like YkuK family protein [Patescibacteria group bacterium]